MKLIISILILFVLLIVSSSFVLGIKVGDSVQIIEKDGLNLRQEPKIDADNIIIVLAESTKATVIGGPENSNGYAWWRVDYNGREGWIAEGSGSTKYISVVSSGDSTEDPVDDSRDSITDIEIGDKIGITVGRLNIRDGSTTSAKSLGFIGSDMTATVIGGPKVSDGYTWWQVSLNGIQGWSAEASTDRSKVYMNVLSKSTKDEICEISGGKCEFWPCSKGKKLDLDCGGTFGFAKVCCSMDETQTDIIKPTTSSRLKKDDIIRVTSPSGLYVRNAPGYDSLEIVAVEPNTEGVIISEQPYIENGKVWQQIAYDTNNQELNGWSIEDYLEKIGSQKQIASTCKTNCESPWYGLFGGGCNQDTCENLGCAWHDENCMGVDDFKSCFDIGKDENLCSTVISNSEKLDCMWDFVECVPSYKVEHILVDYGREKLTACGGGINLENTVASSSGDSPKYFSIPRGTVMKIQSWIGGYKSDGTLKTGPTNSILYTNTIIPWGQEDTVINPKTGTIDKKYSNPYGPAYAHLVTAFDQVVPDITVDEENELIYKEGESLFVRQGQSLGRQLHGTGGPLLDDMFDDTNQRLCLVPLLRVKLALAGDLRNIIHEVFDEKLGWIEVSRDVAFTHGCLRVSNRFILWLEKNVAVGTYVYYIDSSKGDSPRCEDYDN